jgi:hypothetical protein
MSTRSPQTDLSKPGEPAPATEEAPFRFLNLPAELRVEIYGFLCYQDERINLFDVKLPAITRVSRLIRHEALATFFEINHFLVGIHTPYQIIRHGPSVGQFLPTNHERSGLFGTIRLSGLTSATLNSVGAAGVKFRRLDIWPRCAVEASALWVRGGVLVRLAGEVPIAITYVFFGFGQEEAREREDTNYFLQPLQQALEEHIQKNGSEGITFQSLQHIARTVNLPPRDLTRVAERVVRTGVDAIWEYLRRLGRRHQWRRNFTILLNVWFRSLRRERNAVMRSVMGSSAEL